MVSCAADRFVDPVDAAIGLGEDCAGEIRSGEMQNVGSAELTGEIEAGRIDICDEDARAAGGAGGLQGEQANHAGSENEGGGTFRHLADGNRMEGDGGGLQHGGFGKGERGREAVGNALRHSDKFGKGSGAAVVATGDTEDLAAVAEVDFSALAEGAGSAEDRRVEGDAVAGAEAGDGVAYGSDSAGSLMAHDDWGNASPGGAVVAVNIAAADPASGHADEQVAGSGGGQRDVAQGESVVRLKDERSHDFSLPPNGARDASKARIAGKRP